MAVNEQPSAAEVLHQLMRVIQSRKSEASPSSYTARLLAGGQAAVAAKIREEAAELIEAAAADPPDPPHIVHEAADLFYHCLVLLAACDLSLADVEQELARRFGISGIEEKESRPS